MTKTQEVILNSEQKSIREQVTQSTNFVELSTSQSGKVLITVGVGGIGNIDSLISQATKAYEKTINDISSKFAVANEPIFRTEITTSAKGFAQVTVAGEGDKEIATKYNEIVDILEKHKAKEGTTSDDRGGEV